MDPKKTSPYQFYQFWLNASDEDAKGWIKIFTLLPVAQIESLLTEHEAAPHLRLLQKKLAECLTTWVHSNADYDFAVKASEILFGNATTEVLQSLNENELLQVMEGVPTSKVSKALLANGYDLIDLLVETNIFQSKGEAKKMFVAGGLGLNKTKIAQEKTTLNADDLLQGKYLLLQKGKKNYYLVIAE